MAKLIFLLILYLVPFAKSQSDSLVIEINSGLIEGLHVNSPVTNKSYYSFRGIPYAQPPLGELRFRPPVPPKSWNHILETKDDKSICIQHLVPGGSEDCLYLNVYTPTLNKSSELLPVIVVIHGGGFIAGSSSSKSLGPDFLIDKNVVLVTINYRLNVFGFLNAMEESCPGNVGLKDQVAALEWVQENIEAFNGDPKQVTLNGQSAGAASVQYHLQSKLSTGLFHRAIVQSGSTLNNWAFEPNPINLIHKLGNVLNIDSTNITNFINELRQIPAEKLQEASQNEEELLDTKHRTLRTRFIPSIEKDSPNAFLTASSYSILEENEINEVPLLIGYVSNEGLMIFYDPSVNISDYENDPLLLVPKSLNILNDTNTQKLVLAQINHQYFSDDSLPFNLSFFRYEGDEGFVRGVRKTIEFLRKNGNIFHYVFDYKSEDDGLPGVYHSGEMTYIFYVDGWTETEEDKIIREQITTMWANFAKTGNPTPNEDPLLDNIIWPQVSKPEDLLQYMYIGKQLEVRNDTWQEYYQFWEYIFNTYGQPPFYIY